jgi:VWFA-related protein
MMMKKILPALFALAAVSTALAQAPATPPSPAPAPSAVPSAMPSAPPADASASFPSKVEMVTVDVVVTDKKGVAATGLTQADFTVLEDEKPQAIVSFESVQVPATASSTTPQRPRVSSNQVAEARTGRSFVIVFDDVHLTPGQALRAKQAISEFLRTGVREGDRVTLVASGGGAWWSTRMEAGREELIGLLKRLDGRLIPDISNDRMSDHEAMRIHVYRDAQYEQRVSRRFETYGVGARNQQQSEMYQDGDPFVRSRAADVYFQSVSRNRITLEVLQRVLMSLAPARGRKSVILVSQGFIYDPNLNEFKDVIQASRRSNAAMYFVDTRGLGGIPYMSAEFGPAIDNQDIGAAFVETLEEGGGSEVLAADSGGFTVKNTNDLSRGLKRIAEDSRIYYLLGYNPSDPKRDGKFRKIQVKLAGRKGLQIRARKGYYAPLDGAKAAKVVKSSDPDIQAALDSPYDERQVPIRMTSFVFDETLLGKANVLVAADVDVSGFAFQELEGRFADTMEFLMVVAHRETGEFFRYDQKMEMKLLPATRERVARSWMPIVRDFELSPGGYQAKLVVRDKNNGSIGTLVHEFEVPDLASLRVSSPILSDTLQPPTEKGATPRPAMAVRRAFAPATIYAQFEVYGAAREKGSAMPKVTAGYQMLRSDGTVAVQVAATQITPTSLGRLARLVGASLAEAQDGDYEFVLTVTDQVANKTVEVREPFKIDKTVTPPPAPPATPAG